MSNELLGTLIGGIIGVLGTVLGTFITQRSTRKIKEFEMKQKEYLAKRETLTEIYKSLITIINLYPNESPNDILTWIKNSPNYSLESYDSIFTSLDFMLEDYEKQLKSPVIDHQRKNDIQNQISNIKYAKEKLTLNKDFYFKAKKENLAFAETDKTIFDLYASQYVLNCLVEFDVTIYNVFTSGQSVGEPDNPNNNTIKIAKRKIIHAMRSDIGIS